MEDVISPQQHISSGTAYSMTGGIELISPAVPPPVAAKPDDTMVDATAQEPIIPLAETQVEESPLDSDL